MLKYPESYHPLLVEILKKRDITPEQSEFFLHPDYQRDLHNPFLMKGMEKAVDRILSTVTEREKIIIYGDYDADGVPASAILSDWFKKINYDNFDVYIPDRHLEDYGLSYSVIEELSKNGVKLIITVDCGITDVKEVKAANKFGIDVIITDHHIPQGILPDAVAILNPKQDDDKYPFKELCGAGVAFKLVQALTVSGSYPIVPGWEKWLLDLVAIATVSDMVSLTGENRVLTHYGLKVLRQTRRQGLLALFSKLNLKNSYINEDDIAFFIGPRVNSASRMSHASEAFNLLTTESALEAQTIANHLEEKNKERKAIVEEIIKEAEENFKNKDIPSIIIMGKAGWNLGVLGLAASRLIEIFNKPVFLWGKNENGELKGSCRSDGSVNLVELMTEAGGNNLFLNYGGHKMAGGFTLSEGKLDVFGSSITGSYEKLRGDKTDVNKVVVEADAVISIDKVNVETYSAVESLSPFGAENKKPIFCFKNLLIESVKTFGNGGIHLQLTFNNKLGKSVSAVGFFASKNSFSVEKISAGEVIDLYANIELSTFKSRPELRLRIVDIRHSS